MKAKKYLGQNFLTSERIIFDALNKADIDKKSHVIEIGPGKGIFTSVLLKSGYCVFAIEKDSELIDLLKNKFREEIAQGKLTVINEDYLTFNFDQNQINLKDYVIVGNIPYYITGQILRYSLEKRDPLPKKILFLVQKEVGERICAKNKKESVLSLSIKLYGEPKIIKNVNRKYFKPQPRVDSCFLLIHSIKRKLSEKAEKEFFVLIKKAFSQKRKTLRKVLQPHTTDIDFLNKRAENLDITDWIHLLE